MTADNKESNEKREFKTDLYKEALRMHDEMEKKGLPKKEEQPSKTKGRNKAFFTDAFLDALKVHDERDRKHRSRKNSNDSPKNNSVPEESK